MERLHAATVSPSRSLAVATAELPLRVLPYMAGVAAPRKDSSFGTCRVPLGDAQPAGMPPPPPLQPATSHQPPATSRQPPAKPTRRGRRYVRLVRPPSTAALTLRCRQSPPISANLRQSPPISAHLRAARAAPRRAAPPIFQRVSRRHQVRNQKQKVRCALVLLRHGQSRYNLDKIFTGWADPDLTSRGRDEARLAGQLLKGVGINKIEVRFTSLLQRAVKTALHASPHHGAILPTRCSTHRCCSAP